MADDVSETKIQWWIKGPLPNIPPRWNGCPTQTFGVVRQNPEHELVLDSLKWGLLPAWAKDDKIAYNTFNARSEEMAGKPAFRSAWKAGRRCILPVQGFYEWKKLDDKGKEKQPYLISRADKEQMGLAGLWESRKGEGDEIQRTFTGISAPWEPPKDPNLVIDTMQNSLDASLSILLTYVLRAVQQPSLAIGAAALK